MSQTKPSTSREEMKLLIESIGGPPRLFSILLRFYESLSTDLLVGFFFEGKDLRVISEKQGQFILASAGLLPAFSGKGPATAHSALPPILAGHFDRRLRVLEETLRNEGLSSAQIETWVRFEEAFRRVVQAP
jgi:truncated hemoglobin YjbI